MRAQRVLLISYSCKSSSNLLTHYAGLKRGLKKGLKKTKIYTYSFFSQDDMLANWTSGSKLKLGFSIWTRDTSAYPSTSSAKTFKMVDTILWVSLELVKILMLRASFP